MVNVETLHTGYIYHRITVKCSVNQLIFHLTMTKTSDKDSIDLFCRVAYWNNSNIADFCSFKFDSVVVTQDLNSRFWKVIYHRKDLKEKYSGLETFLPDESLCCCTIMINPIPVSGWTASTLCSAMLWRAWMSSRRLRATAPRVARPARKLWLSIAVRHKYEPPYWDSGCLSTAVYYRQYH